MFQRVPTLYILPSYWPLAPDPYPLNLGAQESDSPKNEKVRKITYEIIIKNMQNKPNFRKAKMNLTLYPTKGYENETAFRPPQNKPNTNPKQSQNKPNSLMAKMTATFFPTKGYENESPSSLTENKPNQTHSQNQNDTPAFLPNLMPSFIIRPHSQANSPAAVSPDSITKSVPPTTAPAASATPTRRQAPGRFLPKKLLAGQNCVIINNCQRSICYCAQVKGRKHAQEKSVQ